MIDLKKITINKLKKMSKLELIELSNDIRHFLISLSEKKEIHLSSNLGIVELTISLFLKFNFLKDRVIYDTGHQIYTHKILTNRIFELENMRTENTFGGLMQLSNNKYDHYSPGHSGNSLSVLCGLHNDDNYNVCIIGDSSLNNGLMFEALNYLGEKQLKKTILILNDNEMSISKAKGALSLHLKDIDSINNFFTNLSIQYIGPINGHDIDQLTKYIDKAKDLSKNGPILIHIKTTKGKGHKLAEIDTVGEFHSPAITSSKRFGDCAYQNLQNKLEKNKNLFIINPAMNFGTGFSDLLKNKNYIDTGICEGHALSLASGYSLNNKKIFAIFYSTFLQRAYDQIIHDCIRFKIHLTLLIDRSDIAPHEGDSHHGIFDVGYLNCLPNINIYAPRNFNQLNHLIDYSYNNQNIGIDAIRYPTKPYMNIESIDKLSIDINKFEYLIKNNSKICLITYGPYTNVIYDYFISNKINCNLVSTIKINNLNKKELSNLLNKFEKIIVYERIYGSYGLYDGLIKNIVKSPKYKSKIDISLMSYQNFVGVGTISSIDKKNKMDLESIKFLINKMQ
ncbi:MAG: 1-deoxy-D-xylulose-5-phosphate synthase, partial [Ureaplasma sp.]|nr:1-deoxy-D-xylulose-5-phosphate synthase [Ureaplasma sp.]